MPTPRRSRQAFASASVIVALTAGGCGSGAAPADPDELADATARIDDVQLALDQWRDAATADDAHRAAETVSNLITGPGVELFGDADADGEVGGDVEAGLLPGRADEISLGLPLASCAGDDLLGESWDDPAARWDDLLGKIDAWSPTDNPFPQLTSHAQRVVGWAQLTLRSDDLEDAREFSGHAQLHVDASRDAVEKCR